MIRHDAASAVNAPHYYQNVRAEILPVLAQTYKHVLDIGGGEGRTSQMLRTSGIVEKADLWEYQAEAVEAASISGGFDAVARVDLNALDSWPHGRCYDLIILLDVLEHLYEPWSVLERIRDYLLPGGHIVISLPNVRDATVVAPLLLKGEWRYDDNGVLDRTHFRFFTRRTMRQMIQGAGFDIEREIPIRSGPRQKLNLATLGLLNEVFAKQYVFRCSRRSGE